MIYTEYMNLRTKIGNVSAFFSLQNPQAALKYRKSECTKLLFSLIILLNAHQTLK